jgi:hypothetical protein
MALLLEGDCAALTFDLEGAVDSPPATVPHVDAPRRTLDDVLSETWDGLVAATPAACPVCQSAMAPRWSAGAGVVGGRCGNCGSELG